jgi:predicted O-methyltransferase YrrM
MIEEAIEELESFSKQGDSYTNDKGAFGWRNPIRKDTGRILQSVVSASAPRRMLEIGTAHGLSALYLIQGTDKVSCQLDTIEFDEAVAHQSQRLMDRLNLPVKVIAGEAMAVIGELSGRYDLVFLDAQKSHYGKQIKKLWDMGLIGENTVILADNVLDRATEVVDFIGWFHERGLPYTIIPTECGLLVSKL